MWYVLEKREVRTGFLVRNLKEKGHVEDLGVYGRLILTWI
jgi:hypothetical protein